MQRFWQCGLCLILIIACFSVYAGQVLVSPLIAYSTDQKPIVAFTVFNQTGLTATVHTKVVEYFIGSGQGVYGQDIPLTGEVEANISADVVDLSPKYMILAPSSSQVVRVKVVRHKNIPDGFYAFGVAFKTKTPRVSPNLISTQRKKQKLAVGVQFTLNSVVALYFSKGHLLTKGSIDHCYFNAVQGKIYLLVSNVGTNYYKPKIEIKDSQGRILTTTQFGLLMPKTRGVRVILLDKPDVASVQLAGVDSVKPIQCHPYTAGVTFIKDWGHYHLSHVQP